MRKKRHSDLSSEYLILVLDDEEGIVDSVTALLRRNGYDCHGFTDPVKALKELKRTHYDMLILDYFMVPMHGDAVVKEIRRTDAELYILLLTGHKDMAPPIHTIKELDIQAYCEKSDRMDQLQLLIESGIKSISQMRTVQKYRDGLNSILGAVPKIYQLQPINNILEEILAHILPLVNCEHAFILADDISANELNGNSRKTIFCGIGRYKMSVEHFAETLDPPFMEAIGLARTHHKVVRDNGGIIIPLTNEEGTSVGVIYVSDITSDDGIKLLEMYGAQAASSLNNAILHSLVNMKNDELDQTYSLLKTRYMDTIEVLRLAVDAKDEYTRGHSDRVSEYAVLLGRKMNLPEEEIELLRISGIFHDVGKIGTADDILLKNEMLSEREYREIKKHPIKGAMILAAVSMFQDVVPIVRHHHERMDGKGYPDGITGDEIELCARIISVADAFDAMMSDRQYRTHLSMVETIAQLKNGAGTQFDPHIVATWIELISERPDIFGTLNEQI